MRNISFMLTTPQFLDGSKDVTRRNGWAFLKEGDILCGVEKSQGLGKGGKIKRLGMIRVVRKSREMLCQIVLDRDYGRAEMTREGFPEGHEKHDPAVFMDFFCRSHKGVTPQTVITRIEFEHIGNITSEPAKAGE